MMLELEGQLHWGLRGRVDLVHEVCNSTSKDRELLYM
jgi:hypothetical protein